MNVAIYMEGGGRSPGSRAKLRQGMEVFLDEIRRACSARNWHWRLVCCGGRDEAYKGFRNARANEDAGIVVLLVDSEDPVRAVNPSDHLTARDGWILDGVDDNVVHLMVQTMEAWIVADPEALSGYYKQGFQQDALPRNQNLEEVGKNDIAEALDRATQGSRQGKYHKIHHARYLLQCIDPTRVRRRCHYCDRLFETLLRLVGPAD